MHLDDVEAGVAGARRGVAPGGDQRADVRRVERVRHVPAGIHRLGRRRDRRPRRLVARRCVGGGEGAHAVPRPLAARLAAGMGELDRRNGAVLAQMAGDARERRNVRARPQPDVAIGDAAVLGDRGRLDADDAEPAERELAEMGEMPVAREAVGGAVGAHRRQHGAVAQHDLAEAQRGEQKRLWGRCHPTKMSLRAKRSNLFTCAFACGGDCFVGLRPPRNDVCVAPRNDRECVLACRPP
jgi:hypothetical protein